jgi:ubiquinone/menaquinone biosynthesis C-methylase UbiE
VTENANAIRAAVEQRFAQVARSPDLEQKFPIGPASAKKLGYDPQKIDALLGVGVVLPGQTVLDLGSGPGLDSLLAPRRVGPTGKVVGVDLCLGMVEKAGTTPICWACTTSSSSKRRSRSCRYRTARWTW